MSFRAILFLTLIISVVATASIAEAEFQWPAYQTRRFSEDYRNLANKPAVKPRNVADSLKYLPVSAYGSIWFSLGGNARGRYEGVENFQFNPELDDSGYFMHRYFFWGALHYGPSFRVFLEGKSAWALDRDLPGERRPVDHDELDLQNAFIEWLLPLAGKPALRLGRQELLYGKQRFISPLDWANSRRTWDGALLGFNTEWLDVDFFYTRPVEVKKYDFNEPQSGHDFWGIYSTAEVNGESLKGLDFYLLGQNISSSNSSGTDRYTAGSRLWGSIGSSGLTYDTEGAYQFGRQADNDIRAFALSHDFAWSSKTRWQPGFTIGADFASGDSSPGEGDISTFNQLFPLGHAYLGYADVVGRQNIFNARASLRINPFERFWIQGDLHNFWVVRRQDALYNAGGAVVRSGNDDARRYVGSELDLTSGYVFSHNLQALIGYSYFMAGDFIDDTGGGSDIHYWYTQLALTF